MTKGDFKSEEENGIVELRRRIRGKMSEEMCANDQIFLRFLRARSLNLDAAEDMLTKHLQWRKTSRVEYILKEYKVPKIYQSFVPFVHVGFDKDGSPVSYWAFGNTDMKGIGKCTKVSDFSKFIMHHLEEDTLRLKTQSEKYGKQIDKWTYIIDYDNFTLATATDRKIIDVLISLVKMYDANYPERLKTAYVINASFYFTLLWSVLKPFIAPETTRKVKIFGKDGWREELRQEIGAGNLPNYLGGNRADINLPQGGPIPSDYYVRKDRDSFSKLSGVKRLVVNRRSKEIIKIDVEHPGSNIEWDFDLNNKDIFFSLTYEDPKNEKENREEIVPKQRVDTTIASESGTVTCEKPGTYLLHFDNSFSWINNKIIYYFANVVNPNNSYHEERPNFNQNHQVLKI